MVTMKKIRFVLSLDLSGSNFSDFLYFIIYSIFKLSLAGSELSAVFLKPVSRCSGVLPSILTGPPTRN